MRILAVIYKFSRVIPSSSLLDHDHGARGRGRVCQLPRLCSTNDQNSIPIMLHVFKYGDDRGRFERVS